MPDIEFIRREIVRLRAQVHRQRREITKLQTAGILASSAEALLSRDPGAAKRRFQSPLLDRV
jgi:hypothetical protein